MAGLYEGNQTAVVEFFKINISNVNQYQSKPSAAPLVLLTHSAT